MEHNELRLACLQLALEHVQRNEMNFDDVFEGDSKFYKGPQDFLKRAKEVQAAGKAYTGFNLNDSIGGESTVSTFNIISFWSGFNISCECVTFFADLFFTNLVKIVFINVGKIKSHNDINIVPLNNAALASTIFCSSLLLFEVSKPFLLVYFLFSLGLSSFELLSLSSDRTW